MASTFEIIAFAATVLLMLIGVAGAVLPIIPGAGFIFVLALGHRLWFGDRSPSVWVLVALGIMAMAALAADFGATWLSAKRFGASRLGIFGATAGAFAGMILGGFALLLGPFVGALLSESFGGRNWREATRAGAGATIGVVIGAAAKLVCAVAMVALWSVAWGIRFFG
jgi:uncharacterized protein YqgC (DUF456 family)